MFKKLICNYLQNLNVLLCFKALIMLDHYYIKKRYAANKLIPRFATNIPIDTLWRFFAEFCPNIHRFIKNKIAIGNRRAAIATNGTQIAIVCKAHPQPKFLACNGDWFGQFVGVPTF